MKGYTATEAASPQAALDRLGSDENFDLMLTDVIMPGMDGPKLAEVVAERLPGLSKAYGVRQR